MMENQLGSQIRKSTGNVFLIFVAVGGAVIFFESMVLALAQRPLSNMTLVLGVTGIVAGFLVIIECGYFYYKTRFSRT